MLSIQELCDRYSIASRNTLYNRLNSLRTKGIDVTLVKDAGKSFAPDELVTVLDQQDKWLNAGGTLDNFGLVEEVGTEVVAQEIRKEDNYNQNLIEAIAIALSQIANNTVRKSDLSPAIRDPLWFVDRLIYAEKLNIWLSTSQVKLLIGVKPYGEVFKRGSFVFKKVGRIGRESAWLANVHRP